MLFRSLHHLWNRTATVDVYGTESVMWEQRCSFGHCDRRGSKELNSQMVFVGSGSKHAERVVTVSDKPFCTDHFSISQVRSAFRADAAECQVCVSCHRTQKKIAWQCQLAKLEFMVELFSHFQTDGRQRDCFDIMHRSILPGLFPLLRRLPWRFQL